MADLPSLNALYAFDYVARMESVSLAARALHVTHGAVSRQLGQLQEQLGVVLLQREGRGVRLTEAGHRLHASTREAFLLLRQGCSQVSAQPAGPFVLRCSGSLLARWFIPRLDRLHRDLPQLQLQLSASEETVDLSQETVDAVLWFAQPPWPQSVQIYELAEERIGPVFSPHYQHAAALMAQSPQALLQEPLLDTISRPQAWRQWAQLHAMDYDRLFWGRHFEHLYYLLEAAVAGLGVAIAPEPLVADDLKAGRLLAPWGFVQTPSRLLLCGLRQRRDSRCDDLAAWLSRELQMG